MNRAGIESIVLKIGVLTGIGIVITQFLGILVVYDFFRFDIYLAIVAICFFISGHLLSLPSRNKNLPGVDRNVDEAKNAISKLSNRELAILRMVATGNTNKEIASNMGVVPWVHSYTSQLSMLTSLRTPLILQPVSGTLFSIIIAFCFKFRNDRKRTG